MKTDEKFYKKKWFKPLIAALGIALFILAVEIYVHQPFKGFSKIIKNLNQSAATVPEMDMEKVISRTDPYMGNASAKIKIVEFGDFACPYCRAASGVFRKVIREYENEVFYQFRDYPTVSENSLWLSMAAACAHEQNKFWQFHDRLFQKQGRINSENINQLAKSSGLEIQQFSLCLNEEKYENEVLEDFLSGEDAGVAGTPTFYINGKKFSGAPTEESLRKTLDQLLNIINREKTVK